MKLKANKIQLSQLALKKRKKDKEAKLLCNELGNHKLVYQLGDAAYVHTDALQTKRMVIGIEVYKVGVVYQLSTNNDSSYHFDFEISSKPNLTLTSLN